MRTGLGTVKVGETVVICDHRGETAETVTKVGRLLVHAGGHKYAIDTGKRTGPSFGAGHYAWSPDALESAKRRNVMLEKLRWAGWASLRDHQLRRIVGILEESQ